MRHCLIISPHFPPSMLAGVHRARHLVKHLPKFGWRVTIVCVDSRFHIEALDRDLASLVPLDAAVVATKALPLALTSPIGLSGDIGLRGLGHLRSAIDLKMRRDRPHTVMITGSPYPMLLSKRIQTRWRTPVVLDFQDPWVSPTGDTTRFGTKAWVAHKLARMLEPRALRHASFVTSVSDRQNAELADRYPWIDSSRMAGIPIGGDPEDFLPRLNVGEIGPSKHLDARKCNLNYAGTIWPAAMPVLSTLFKGVRALRDSRPDVYEKLRFNFLGTTANPRHTGESRVMAAAEAFEVSSSVYEVPERRPYLEAVDVMTHADVNLVIGSTEPHYTASKVYPVLMAGRRHLSLLHRASSAHEILSAAGGGVALAFDTAKELDALVPKVAEAIIQLVEQADSVGTIDPKAYAAFSAQAVAEQFARVFDCLVEDRVARRVKSVDA